MKILVTGGSGFLGSHLVDRLVADGHQVLVVDHQKKEKKRFPNPKADVYKMAFGSEETRQLILAQEPQAIIHLAAQISVPFSISHPIEDAQINIVDSVKLLEAAAEAGVETFLFASSGGAIYGDYPQRPTPEVMDAMPLSPYGIGKQMFEHYLAWAAKAHGMRTVALRFANLYGPRQQTVGEAGVIAIFIDRLQKGKPVTIFGDGAHTRDFLFVEDAVEAFVHALEHPFAGVVNISTGVETSILELYRLLQNLHSGAPEPVFGPPRTGDVRKSLLDPRLAKTAIDWEPRVDFEQGLKRTYDWFIAQNGQ